MSQNTKTPLFIGNAIKLALQPSREGNKMLKEPLKKRGDGAFYFPHGVLHQQHCFP